MFIATCYRFSARPCRNFFGHFLGLENQPGLRAPSGPLGPGWGLKRVELSLLFQLICKRSVYIIGYIAILLVQTLIQARNSFHLNQIYHTEI